MLIQSIIARLSAVPFGNYSSVEENGVVVSVFRYQQQSLYPFSVRVANSREETEKGYRIVEEWEDQPSMFETSKTVQQLLKGERR